MENAQEAVQEEVTLENGDVFDGSGEHIGSVDIVGLQLTHRGHQLQVLIDGKFYVYTLTGIEKAEISDAKPVVG